MCLHQPVCIYRYFVRTPLCLYYAKHEFLLTSPMLIRDHVSHYSLPAFCAQSLQQRVPWLPPSAIHLLHFSIPKFTMGGFRIINSYPMGNTSSIYSATYNFFCFRSYEFHSFPTLLAAAHFILTHSVG